jgi:hypothetical protein
MTTLSVATQTPLVTVQRNVYEFPATPEKFDVGLEGVVIVPPVPLIIDQAPVPGESVFPARVTLVNPQVEVPV